MWGSHASGRADGNADTDRDRRSTHAYPGSGHACFADSDCGAAHRDPGYRRPYRTCEC